ncbi:unnamed protein product [Pedinophyceae sp. YPF-701]|nr:unnamed protein product [Pedinophyceae sp. YPF-701]
MRQWPAAIVCVLLGMAWAWFVTPMLFADDDGVYATLHVSCEHEQPLVQVTRDFLPHDDLAKLRACADRFSQMDNALDEENFGGTYGLMLAFNRGGLADLRHLPHLSCLLPYLDAARNPDANTFVMNVLSVQPRDSAQDDSPAETAREAEGLGPFGVGPHVDNTARHYLHPYHEFVAHQVNVIYLEVPSDMDGGELVVWTVDSDEHDPPALVLPPVNNTMVEFRGDALHAVRAFRSPSASRRLGLVLEQYKIPEELYEATARLHISQAVHHVPPM